MDAMETEKSLDKFIYLAKSADVKPVVHAHWIERYRNGFGNMVCECSNCHFNSKRRNFCFNCGATMDESEEL